MMWVKTAFTIGACGTAFLVVLAPTEEKIPSALVGLIWAVLANAWGKE